MNDRLTNASQASSPGFAATLAVDPCARRLLRHSALLLYVAGLWLVAGMPLAPVAKALLGLAWSADVAILLARFGRLQRRLVAVCADEGGGLAGAGPAGESFALALLPGSIVTSRLAWLRLQFPDGCRHAELFLERHADAGAWHRFRLVTRLAGRRFGHADRP